MPIVCGRRLASENVTGQFVLLLADPTAGSTKITMPPPGPLRDVSPKLCSSNLPFIDLTGLDEGDGESSVRSHGLAFGAGDHLRALESLPLARYKILQMR